MSACREWNERISGYLDGELPEEEALLLEAHLETCPDCRREYEEGQRLMEVTDKMNFLKPPEELWERYWDNVYNRLERRVGWILLSLGAIILAAYGLYALVTVALPDFWRDPDVPTVVKAGAVVLALGLAALLVSAARERPFAYKSDRYKEVKR